MDPVFSWSGDRFLEERFWPLLRLVSEAEEEEEEARAPLCQLVSTIDRAKSSVDGTPTQLSSVATEWNTPDAGVKRIWGGFVSAVEQQEEGVDLSEMVAPDGPLNPDIIMVLHYPTETCGSNMRKFGTVVDTVNPTTARLDHAVNGLSGVLVFDIRPIRLRPGCPAPPDLRDPAAAKLPIYKFTNPPLTLQKSLTRLMDELLCSLLAEAKAKVGVI